MFGDHTSLCHMMRNVTELFKMDDQQGLTIEHMELCSMFCGTLDGRRVWGRMDICICMAESLHRGSCETVTALLIGSMLI